MRRSQRKRDQEKIQGIWVQVQEHEQARQRSKIRKRKLKKILAKKTKKENHAEVA